MSSSSTRQLQRDDIVPAKFALEQFISRPHFFAPLNSPNTLQQSLLSPPMAHQPDNNEDVNLEVEEDDEEEYIEAGEVDEEETINEGDHAPMDDDDEEDGTVAGFHGTRSVEGDEEMVEVVDDSVQGFFAHKEPVYSIGIHPTDENIIVTGGGDDKGYLWRADTGDQLFELAGHTDSVTAVGFSTTGDYVATGGMDGKVKVWKVATGELLATVDGPDEIVWLNWHPKGNILLAGATDSTIWMWAMPSGKFMNVFSGHSGAVTQGLFTPDGKKVVSVSEDGTLIAWDPKTASSTIRLSGDDARFHQDSINTVAVHKDSVLALTGSADSSARLVNLNTGAIVASFENHTDSVETVGFSSALPLAATGSVDGKLNIWDVTTMRLRQTCQHDDAIVKLQWHNNSPLITTGSADRTVKLWDGRTGNCEKTWMGHQDVILDFALSADGRMVVTGSDDGTSLVFRM